jgi:glutaminase
MDLFIFIFHSKPLTYAIALNELGQDTVHQYVGQEPSGRMFNELVLDHNSKPSKLSDIF